MREVAQFSVPVQSSDPQELLCKGGLLRAEPNSEHTSSPYPWVELIVLLGWRRLTVCLRQTAFPHDSNLAP